MRNFTFQNQTKIIFGRDTENNVGSEIKPYANRVMIHFGSGSIKKSGLFDRVTKSLKAAGVGYIEFGGAKPNPRISLVREGIQICRANKIDFVLAVGGGSTIDSAKAICIGTKYGGDVWDFYAKNAEPTAALDLGVVLTIPAAGSESSDSSVLTNDDSWLKRSCDSRFILPKFAILNPELTYTLSSYQTACGAVDIMAHVMERYFSNEPHTDLTDRLAEGIMKTVIKNAPIAIKEPENYDARAEIMWAGTCAHNNLIGCGRIADWASHPIEHELSAEYDIAHGGGLAIIFPAWMRYVYKSRLDVFVRFATRVWNLDYDRDEPERIALEGIRLTQQFYKNLGLPVTFVEAGIPTDKIRFMSEKCDRNELGVVGHFVELTTEDVEQIYLLAIK